MSPTNHIPLDQEKISHLFYELEFAPQDKKQIALKEIASHIPWQYSIYETIEMLKDPVLRMTSRQYARLIQTERTCISLKRIAGRSLSRNYKDLEEGAFLLSELGEPYCNYFDFRRDLERITNNVRELYDNNQILTEESKLQLLIRVLSEIEGFNGNARNYEDPDNSYITKVLRTKTGLPISLSVIYILVGRRLGLPLYGTNLPFHFLVFYDSTDYSIYIDPFNGGLLLDRQTCENFLELHGFEPSQEYFARSSTTTILQRMVRNLINAYKKKQKTDYVKVLNLYLQVLEKKR